MAGEDQGTVGESWMSTQFRLGLSGQKHITEAVVSKGERQRT